MYVYINILTYITLNDSKQVNEKQTWLNTYFWKFVKQMYVKKCKDMDL